MTRKVWATAVAAPVEPKTTAPEHEETEPVEPTGPTAPDPESIPAPDAVDRTPVKTMPSRTGGQHYYLAAHGGAGATTLTALDPDGADAGGVWPTHDNGQNVVVVARQSATGLRAARHLAQQWGAGQAPGATILALVTIPAQPGKRPPSISRELRTTAGMFPLHYEMDWNDDRLTENPDEHSPTKRDQRILRTIHRISKGTP